MPSWLKKAFRFIRLGLAFWLIGDTVLDGIQAPKYYHLSPYLNHEHEANSNLTDRILHFCEKLDWNGWNDSRLDTKQKMFTSEWTNRCKESDFNFECLSNFLDTEQLDSLKVCIA